MAYVIDARNSGGAVVVLGDALTLPASSSTPQQSDYPALGSIRFNPQTQGLEVFRTNGSGGYQWRAIEQITADTSSFYSTSGGPVSGNIVMVNQARLLVSNGNASFPSISFDQYRGTGLSVTNSGDLQLSSRSVLTAILSSSGAAISGQINATTAQFNTLTADTVQAGSIQTAVPHDISTFVRGTYTASLVMYRYVAAHTLSFPANWSNSFAYSQSAPTSTIQCTITKISGNNTTNVGTINFLNNSTTGSFGIAAAFSLQPGDIIEIKAPSSADQSFAGLSLSLVCNMATQ